MDSQEQKIEQWKKQYGKIFKIVISGETYIYRVLKRSEYKAIQNSIVLPTPTGGEITTQQNQEMQNALEEAIVKCCVLSPENIDVEDTAAGVPSVLAPIISEISGYQIQEEPVEL